MSFSADRSSGFRRASRVLSAMAVTVMAATLARSEVSPQFVVSEDAGSAPLDLTVADSGIFFSADDGLAGRELWRRAPDGEVHMVADLVPGPRGSAPNFLTARGDAVYFFAGSHLPGGKRSRQLFVTRGAPETTQALSDFTVTPDVHTMAVAEWGVVFSASNPGHGLELWAALRDPSRPTGWRPAYQLDDFAKGGEDGLNLGPIVEFHNAFLFAARPDTNAPGDSIVWVWRSGSDMPEPLRTVEGDLISCRGQLEVVEADGQLYLAARGDAYDVWVADQNLAHVRPLMKANPRVPRPDELCVFDGSLYFAYQNEATGRELFTVDSATMEPLLVADVNPGPADSSPYSLTPYEGGIAFNARHEEFGIELWSLAAATGDVEMLGDFMPGRKSSNPYQLTAFADGIYFSCAHPDFGEELWTSDGSPDGVRLLYDLNPGPALAEPYHLVVMDGKLYFTAHAPEIGEEIWSISPESDRPKAVTRIRPTLRSIRSSQPDEFVAVEDTLYFVATSAEFGRELWSSDGTFANTRNVIDLIPGVGSSSPSELRFHSESRTLRFNATDETGQKSAWAYHVDSRELTPLVPSVRSRVLSAHEALIWNPEDERKLDAVAADRTSGKIGDLNVFAGWTQEFGRELWAIRDAEHFPFLIADICPGPASGNPRHLAFTGRYAVFAAQGDGRAATLWISDGTSTGTHAVGSGVPVSLAAWEYGVATIVRESDGRRRILNYLPETDVIVPRLTEWQEQNLKVRDLAVVNRRVFFVATHPSFGEELWCMGGIDSDGAYLVRDIATNAVPSTRSRREDVTP